MNTLTWVVAAGAAQPTLEELEAALLVRGLPYLVVSATQVGEPVAPAAVPGAAMVVGGPLGLPVLAALGSVVALSIPSLVLVNSPTEQQEAYLLASGAFDVVGLPVSPVRLVSRVAAFHRNAVRAALVGEPPEQLSLGGGVRLFPTRREVRVHDRLLHATRTEFDLLLLLGRTPGRVLSRRELREQTQGRSSNPRALESHVSRLRTKIAAAGGTLLIQSVRGVGYRLTDHLGKGPL